MFTDSLEDIPNGSTVAQALSGLGPLSVTRRQVTTEIQVRRKQVGRRPGRRPVTAGRDRLR